MGSSGEIVQILNLLAGAGNAALLAAFFFGRGGGRPSQYDPGKLHHSSEDNACCIIYRECINIARCM